MLLCVAAAACSPVRRGAGTSPRALVLAQKVEHVDRPGREPMVVEHPSGTLFVAGYGAPTPSLWKSADRGATWSRVNVGSEAEGAVGNSDVDLAIAGDGTLYFVTMRYDRIANEGRHIVVGVSRDVATTWSWTRLSNNRFDDRPWVAVAPDGTAHVIWNDGSGVHHAVSRDRGAAWTRARRMSDKGGSSHLAVGPGGEVAVRVTPASASGNKFDAGVDLIAVSADAGATWQARAAPGHRVWENTDAERWVEPLAWDERGVLYSFWTDDRALWLARSTNRGATWASWRVAEGRDTAYFPYLSARGVGELAATWFSGHGDNLQWHVAHLAAGVGGEPPRVIQSAPLRTDSWAERPDAPMKRDTAGEYLAVTFLRDGSLGAVTPIQASQRAGFCWWRFELR